MNAISTAPASWWRPPLEMMRLLDALAADARPPIGIIAARPDVVVPALIRLPAARCLTIDPWRACDRALLATGCRFVGVQPVVVPLSTAPRHSLQTVLWFDPGVSLPATQPALVASCLVPNGRLTVVIRAGPVPMAGLSILRLRLALRRAGMRLDQSCGYLGPRALAWSAAGRLALAAGRPDLYDRCHAAMRIAYTEAWPLALFCRTVVVTARTLC